MQLPAAGNKLKEWFDSPAFEQAYHCTERLGAYLDDMGTHFALWAPLASEVQLNLYADGCAGPALLCVPMTKLSRGLWRYDVARSLHGTYYDYVVTTDGTPMRTADPYARACGLNGARSMVVDLSLTNPEGWTEDKAPERTPEEVVYELHIKDFSWDPHSGVPEDKRGKYAALTLNDTTLDGRGVQPTCLNHIKRLGATHVQLMPVYDYGSVDEGGDKDAFNWGYDPVNYNVPEGSYSSDPARGEVRIRELKEAIQALHKNGLRVVMDVVYNHTYHLDSWLFRSVPWYYYRQDEEGKASNGSGCGSEIASERSMCARYILESVLYWAEEYHIDGFRFDLMGMLDTALINRIQTALDERYGKGEKIVYGEPWAGGACHACRDAVLCTKDHMKQLLPAVGAFCDNTRDAIKGSVMQAESQGIVNGGGLDANVLANCITAWSGGDHPFAAPSQTITYMSAHDDWTLWDKLVCSMGDGKSFEACPPALLRANRLAAAILMCCQGRLFMLSGEEFCRTKLGIRDSYKTPVEINRMDWQRAFRNRELVEYYRGLIALRKQLPGLCDKSASARRRLQGMRQIAPDAAAYLLDNTGGESRWGALVMGFNASQQPVRMRLPQGTWQVLADEASSFQWQQVYSVEGAVTIPPVSAMILGLAATP